MASTLFVSGIGCAAWIPSPNFKAATFADPAHNALLRELEADIGAVTLDEIAALRAACQETGRRWTVYFSERLENAATVRAGELVGTLPYLAPEQIRRHRTGVDQRVDTLARRETAQPVLSFHALRTAAFPNLFRLGDELLGCGAKG